VRLHQEAACAAIPIQEHRLRRLEPLSPSRIAARLAWAPAVFDGYPTTRTDIHLTLRQDEFLFS